MGCWTYWTLHVKMPYIVVLVLLEVTKKVFILTSERFPCVSYRPQLIENAKCCHPSNDSSTPSSVFHPSCTPSSLFLKVALHSCEGGRVRMGGSKATLEKVLFSSQKRAPVTTGIFEVSAESFPLQNTAWSLSWAKLKPPFSAKIRINLISKLFFLFFSTQNLRAVFQCVRILF